MKKHLLLIFILGVFFFTGNAQNNITLRLNHHLAEETFALNKMAKNNLNQDFNVSRLEYYISEISIVHDGGVETVLEGLRFLIDTQDNASMTHEIGSYDITNVEKIKWHIGVEKETNHEDPSLHKGADPLAPKFPSMHWGWAAGYRFVALEGNGGNLSLMYQLHGLGDVNYFETVIDCPTTAVDNNVMIDINADYTRVLEDIPLNDGVIVHGEGGAAQKALENFRDYVFAQAEDLSKLDIIAEQTSFSIFPNPSNDGQINITFDTNISGTILVTDILGRKIKAKKVENVSTTSFNISSPGIHFVSLNMDGKIVQQEKVIIQ